MYRINQLLKADQKLFHTQDLALLWGISNKNTLYTLIKRYIDRGILIPIHKGFYSAIPIAQIDPLRLGVGYLHRYAYLSCETILFREGIISQYTNKLSIVSSISARFELNGQFYMVRKLDGKYLYNDLGIISKNGLLAATAERAMADMLYFNPKFNIDVKGIVSSKTVIKIRKEVYGI